MSADTTTVVRWRVHPAKPRTRHVMRDTFQALCWVSTRDWKPDDTSIRTCPRCLARLP